jgi:pimeloyl-ACP methyl ester carboxylesterase
MRDQHRQFKEAVAIRGPIRSFATRLFMASVVFLLAFALMCVDAVAQEQKTKTKQAPVDRSLRTKDDWEIKITYYESVRGKEAPVVVLLHHERGNRFVWMGDDGFAERLRSEGYAVISVDLRKHGESRLTNLAKSRNRANSSGSRLTKDDYLGMVTQDLAAVKQFIYDEHQRQNLNMRKTAIIGPEMSAALAINFALKDWMAPPFPDAPLLESRTPRGQDVRALILLSPEDKPPIRPALRELRNPAWGVSVLVCYGEYDKRDNGVSANIRRTLLRVPGNKDRIYLVPYPLPLRGTALLRKKIQIEDHMLEFLRKHLKELPDAWRDRKSRLQ